MFSWNMAYLKRFAVIFVLLMVIYLIIGKAPSAYSGDGLHEASKSSAQNSVVIKKSPRLIEDFYAKQLENLNITLRPGTDHRKDSKETPTQSRRCKSLVYQAYEKLPTSHQQQLKELTLFYSAEGRRGLGGSGSVVLRCSNLTDRELVSVFVHEMGHLVDGSLLSGSQKTPTGFFDFDNEVPADDASLMFYKITWNSNTEMKEMANELDFVSLYAMSDPFEDFAETYTYYRLHGSEFRKLAKTIDALNEKYNFMKIYVFNNEEFGFENRAPYADLWDRNYDVTVLPFVLKSFLS